MNCSRCGASEAVVKRDAAFYCGKCALARDWEEVIALVQEERVSVSAGASVEFDVGASEPAEAAAAPSSNGELPAAIVGGVIPCGDVLPVADDVEPAFWPASLPSAGGGSHSV